MGGGAVTGWAGLLAVELLVSLVAVELLAGLVGISGGCVYLLRMRRRGM